jgi:Zn-dependent metalloprotease
LNESISDVFGIQVKQYALKQTAAEADWLIGADIVGPEFKPALRSMREPGKANKFDEQPATMDGYVDGGDVHINSGIPNHAFFVVATTLGGNSWDVAGPIWYAALTDPSLPSDASFRQFAQVTLKHAQQLQIAGMHPAAARAVDAVKAGWDAVKLQL